MEFLEPEQVKELLETKTINKDFVIVDVRGDDFASGNIPGCTHIPSDEFLELKEYPFEQVPTVIFHCHLSQVRGPKCAQRFSTNTGKKAFVLKGGISQFQAKFKDTKFIENHNQDFWDAE
ncbi:Rhodanese-like domain-containing protein [Gorgonomyces haynaldii]|nr:Rhodanese-like domain-containing protein [Gorgonomyces haynaldii]